VCAHAADRQIASGEAILRVEKSGMCFSDVDTSWGKDQGSGKLSYRWVPGHAFFGRIATSKAKRQRRRWVRFERTMSGRPASTCISRPIHGLTPTSIGSGLWGGYSQYVVLQLDSVVHHLPEHLSSQDAALFNPIGSGFDWAVRAAGTCVGGPVLVIGPGPCTRSRKRALPGSQWV
jgi:threonine dehydrogenase-like Zn-dependent dehydrogenase